MRCGVRSVVLFSFALRFGVELGSAFCFGVLEG